MKNTTAPDVIQSFESSFADKEEIPFLLELGWLKKAIGRYSIELDELAFDDEILQFNCVIDRYVIDTLAAFMKEYYQERQVSKVNKRVSIVGKDISIDGSNGTKTAEKAHLEYVESKANEMIANQTPTAYA